ncbi:MAG: hypothetical protein QHD01_26245 [Bradyrhizobium sp.]|uniref:hypothetical protein n=1 Tax=Bradyrhizobium sp. TaxID=376 RepID=UPI0029AA6920|nr:hypothetical protein [Bradyrhizobium sp.]MDX3970080.1 hypothetical protein [Bradyrhizobium sp.]
MARKKLNKIDGQFNARLIEMMESPAYRVLSLSAHRVMDRISIELAQHGGNDNGKLPVTYEHFMEYGIDRHAIAPAIRELEALGFVEVTQRGKPSAGEFRTPNLFRITWVNCKSTPIPSHEWRRISDMETAEALARTARKQKANGGNPHRANGGNPHCESKSPVLVVPTTVPPHKTPTTSISPVGTLSEGRSRSAPLRSAVASDRPTPQMEATDPELAAALNRLSAVVRVSTG